MDFPCVWPQSCAVWEWKLYIFYFVWVLSLHPVFLSVWHTAVQHYYSHKHQTASILQVAVFLSACRMVLSKFLHIFSNHNNMLFIYLTQHLMRFSCCLSSLRRNMFAVCFGCSYQFGIYCETPDSISTTLRQTGLGQDIFEFYHVVFIFYRFYCVYKGADLP